MFFFLDKKEPTPEAGRQKIKARLKFCLKSFQNSGKIELARFLAHTSYFSNRNFVQTSYQQILDGHKLLFPK